MKTVYASESILWGDNIFNVVPCDPQYGDPANMTLVVDFYGEGPSLPSDTWDLTVLNGMGEATWQAGWPTKFYDDGTYE